jgi:NAD(P)-dependent dehydrogenase (short-subunit alcohol dehydrogenase family)
MGKLDGKVAVITGGTRGLGLAIARAFAREGAAVVVASRSAGSVEEAVAALKQAGARAAGQACDVGDLAQVEALAAYAETTFGKLDVWVNNAGLSAAYGPTAGVWPEEFRAVVETNILGTYHGSITALRRFVPAGRGKIINMVGAGEKKPVPLQSAYASSKGWIRNLTLALAKEYEGSGVGIFAMQPGLMLTDMVMRPVAVGGWEEKVKVLGVVLGILGNPPEVPAELAVRLASAETDGKTGLQYSVLTTGAKLRAGLRALGKKLSGKGWPRVPLEIQSAKPYIESSKR